MVWTLGILLAPEIFGLPIVLFIAPLAVFFIARLLLSPLLYSRRVPCPRADMAGAALAGMALSHSIARGVIAGLVHRQAVFEVTRKGNSDNSKAQPSDKKTNPFASVREEATLLCGLLACIAALTAFRPPDAGIALAGWLLALTLQALPYAAAVTCAWLSRTRQHYRAKPNPARP